MTQAMGPRFQVTLVLLVALGSAPSPVLGQDPETAAAPKTRAKYLLLDRRIIATVDNAKLTVGAVKKHPANPLFGEDRPWEKRFDNLYANLLHDETDGLYQCWYSPFIVDLSSKGMAIAERSSTPYRPPRGREMGVCYAVSRDGLQWEKPELNLVEFEGNEANNLVLRGPHGAGVCKDPGDPDPTRRYKMFHARDVLRFSSDGLHWSDPLPCSGVDSKGDTHNNMLFVPELKRYAAFVRLRDGSQRIVGRTESADLKHWTKAVEVLRNNAQDQAYSMPVFRYADVYLGLVAIFRTREDRVHTELAWSPDTVTWHRLGLGTPFIGNSPKEGDYDWGCVYAANAPVVLDDEIRIYYGGSNGKHTSWRDGFFCLATLRPDGWAGYEPVNPGQPAVVVTTNLPHNGQPIRVTADVGPGGFVKASIVDQTGRPLHLAKSVTTTVTNGELQWDREITAGSIQLRFELTGAKLYAFQVSGGARKPGPQAQGPASNNATAARLAR